MTDSLPSWLPEDPGPGGTLLVDSPASLDSNFTLTGAVNVLPNGQLIINQDPNDLDKDVTFALKGDSAELVISEFGSTSEAKVINNDNLYFNFYNATNPSYVLINRNGLLVNQNTVTIPYYVDAAFKANIFLYYTKLEIARGGELQNRNAIYSEFDDIFITSGQPYGWNDDDDHYFYPPSIIINNGTFNNYQRLVLSGDNTVLINKGYFYNHASIEREWPIDRRAAMSMGEITFHPNDIYSNIMLTDGASFINQIEKVDPSLYPDALTLVGASKYHLQDYVEADIFSDPIHTVFENEGTFYLARSASIQNIGIFYDREGKPQSPLFANGQNGTMFIDGDVFNEGYVVNVGKMYLTGQIKNSESYDPVLRNDPQATLIIQRQPFLDSNASITGTFENRGTLSFDSTLTNSSRPEIYSVLQIYGDYQHKDEAVFVPRHSYYLSHQDYQLIVSDDVDLSGSLNLDELLLDFQIDQLLTNHVASLVSVGGDLTGHFDDLPEGALVYPEPFMDDTGLYHELRITYEAGDGNDVALYTSPISSVNLATSSDDSLVGSSADDFVRADGGDDEIYGDLGSDVLTGGEGSDRFVYLTYFESWRGAESRDVITDFSSSDDDKIDLSAIAEDFVFIGSSDFTGAKPEIRFDDGILQLANPDFYTPLFAFYEPDTAPTPIFEIQLFGVDSLSVYDLIL